MDINITNLASATLKAILLKDHWSKKDNAQVDIIFERVLLGGGIQGIVVVSERDTFPQTVVGGGRVSINPDGKIIESPFNKKETKAIEKQGKDLYIAKYGELDYYQKKKAMENFLERR